MFTHAPELSHSWQRLNKMAPSHIMTYAPLAASWCMHRAHC